LTDPATPIQFELDGFDSINPQKKLFPSSSPSRPQASSLMTKPREVLSANHENITPTSQPKSLGQSSIKKSPPSRPVKSQHRVSIVDIEMQEIKSQISSLQQELRYYEQVAGYKGTLVSEVTSQLALP
jgi:hypothetical protein